MDFHGDKYGGSRCIQEVVIVFLCKGEENFRVTSVLNVYVQRLNFDSTQVEVTSRPLEGLFYLTLLEMNRCSLAVCCLD
jgi:hypothetical protein